jgi:hypothetical protein
MNGNNSPDDGWVPLAQAAAVLTSTPLNVLMHIKRGLLVGKEFADGWRVEAQSLAALTRQRRETGAATVCASGCSKAHGCKSCG